jgi:ferredoxin
MRVAVSAERCCGHGRCYDLGAPVFSSDDEGFAAERGSEFDVAGEHEPAARAGAASCPQGAITLLERS